VLFRRLAVGIASIRRRDNRLRPLRKAKADKPEDHCAYDISIFHKLVWFHCIGLSLIWVFTEVLQKIRRDITREFGLFLETVGFPERTEVLQQFECALITKRHDRHPLE
jgi:hypothetical protein